MRGQRTRERRIYVSGGAAAAVVQEFGTLYTIQGTPDSDPNSRYLSHSVDSDGWNTVGIDYDGTGDGNNYSTDPQFDAGPILDFQGNDAGALGDTPVYIVWLEFDPLLSSERMKCAAFLSDDSLIGTGFDFGHGFEIKSASTGLTSSAVGLYSGVGDLSAFSPAGSYLERCVGIPGYTAGPTPFLFGALACGFDAGATLLEYGRLPSSVGGIDGATRIRLAVGQSAGGVAAVSSVRFRCKVFVVPFGDMPTFFGV